MGVNGQPPEAVASNRREQVALMVAYGRAFRFADETIYDSVQLMDRLALRNQSSNDELVPVIAGATLLIAARQSKTWEPWSLVACYELRLKLLSFGDAA